MITYGYRYILLALFPALLLLSGCVAQAPKVTYGQPENTPPVVAPAEQRPLQADTSVPVAAQEIAKTPAPVSWSEATVQKPSAPTIATDAANNINYLRQRLAVYERKFQQWLEIQPEGINDNDPWTAGVRDDCLAEFNSLFTGYNQLLAHAQRPGRPAGEWQQNPETLNILQLDINFLEGNCGRKLDQTTSSSTGNRPDETDMFLSTEQAEKIIEKYFQQGEYDQVITVFQLTAKAHPEIVPSLKTRQLYSMAHLHNGNLETATENLENILSEIEFNDLQLQPWVLQRQTADLLLATGRPDEARLLYGQLLAASDSFTRDYSWAERQLTLLNEISPADLQMTYFTDLLRSFLIFDSKMHNPVDVLAKADDLMQIFPNTPVADSAGLLKRQVENKLMDWTDGQLAEAGILLEEKRYQQAMAILVEMNPDHLPANLRERVHVARAQVKEAEKQELEAQRLLLEQSLAVQWQSAITLLDSELFDAAIISFETLLDTEYNDQATRKIKETANLAATAQRKESASLFIKAVKAQHLETKQELLLKSRRLLQDVLLKYPTADIIDKVAQNLETLEQHIREFNPSLLEQNSRDQSQDETTEELETPDQPQDQGSVFSR